MKKLIILFAFLYLINLNEAVAILTPVPSPVLRPAVVLNSPQQILPQPCPVNALAAQPTTGIVNANLANLAERKSRSCCCCPCCCCKFFY